MNKKTISIIGITIAVLVLSWTAFAAVSNMKETRKLSEKVDEIQQNQDEFSLELQKVAQNVPQKEEESEEINGEANANETKDWNVYINEKYGYSIKYPPGLKVSISKSNENIVNFCKTVHSFGINIINNAERIELQNKALLDAQYADHVVKSVKKTIVNDREAIIIIYDTFIPYPQGVYSCYISNDNIIVNIKIFSSEEPYSFKKFVELIIGSLRFQKETVK